MAKLAVVATIKIVPDKRDEYVKHLRAHASRCRATEPGTLQFDILTPHGDPDTVMLYELYTSPEAFDAHINGESMKQMRLGRALRFGRIVGAVGTGHDPRASSRSQALLRRDRT